MASAAGTLGRPGMAMISPVKATTKPAPALKRTWRTVMVKSSGRPVFLGSSERDYCVLAMQTGKFPSLSSLRSWVLIPAAKETFFAP